MISKNLAPKVTHILPNDVNLIDKNDRPFFSHSDMLYFSDAEVWKGTF